MLHVKLLREDGFCDAVELQDRDIFELYASEALSWKRLSLAVASELYLLRTKSLSLFWQSSSLAKPEILTPFGTCSAAQDP